MSDYISREAVIAKFREDAGCDGCIGKRIRTLCESCFARKSTKIIGNIPPADVRPAKWIPVTERLPPEGKEMQEIYEPARWSEKVLFWHMGCGLRIGWYSHTFNLWSVSGNILTIRADFVTHWMPLLEPPEAEVKMK